MGGWRWPSLGSWWRCRAARPPTRPSLRLRPAVERSGGAHPVGAGEERRPPKNLDLDQALERTILPGEAHEYRVALASGEYFELEVEQRGVDVGLSWFDPRGELLLEMDLPTADLGFEPLVGVAEETGSYRLRVEAWESEDAAGSYVIAPLVRRPAGDPERLRARAARSFHAAERLFWSREYAEALSPYQEAMDLWRQAGDEFWQAETLDRIGSTHRRLGDWAEAAGYHARALELFEGLDEPTFTAVSSTHMGMDCYELGEMEASSRYYARSLELQRRLGDRRGQGISLGSLAEISKIQGETQRALDNFQAALELLDRPEDRRYRAPVLHNYGTLFRLLGKRQSAVEYLRQAERAYAAVGDARGQASSLSQIGQLAFEAGELERALRLLRHSLDLRRQLEDRRGEAVALRKIGSVLLAEGTVDGALDHYLRALELLDGLGSPRSEAAVLTDLGRLQNRLGRFEDALVYHRAALDLYERVGDPVGEAEALLSVADSERRRGRLVAARAAGERALEIAETLRLRPLSEDLRFSFFSTAQRFFDFYIDLLMELDRADPAAGHGARALQASERGRARSLLDLLGEAGAEIRADAAPGLLEEERAMQRLLNRSVELMEDETASDGRREAAARQVRRALEGLEAARAAIRRQSPRYAALTQPRPLDVDEIQRQVLDGETVLLEYRLGPDRSFLWFVTADELSSYELAPASEIERSVQAAHTLLRAGPRRESEGRTRALLCELSRLLLRPVAGRLGRKRLAIVADGALEYLPFAALPDPEAQNDCLEAEPLVAAHEIVYLPSASTLAVLRREERSRETPAATLAVLADPVFSADDERLGRPAAGSAGATRGAANGGAAAVSRDGAPGRPVPFPRLRHSRAEAEAILGMVPPAEAYGALDFDASRQVVLSGRLEDYRILHFATHGVLNAEEPALSGNCLVASGPKRSIYRGLSAGARDLQPQAAGRSRGAGRVRDGTRQGSEGRGPGRAGPGFMYAGASRVMVSLWKVSDRGTADLMGAFYRNLLQAGPRDRRRRCAGRSSSCASKGRSPSTGPASCSRVIGGLWGNERSNRPMTGPSTPKTPADDPATKGVNR